MHTALSTLSCNEISSGLVLLRPAWFIFSQINTSVHDGNQPIMWTRVPLHLIYVTYHTNPAPLSGSVRVPPSSPQPICDVSHPLQLCTVLLDKWLHTYFPGINKTTLCSLGISSALTAQVYLDKTLESFFLSPKRTHTEVTDNDREKLVLLTAGFGFFRD